MLAGTVESLETLPYPLFASPKLDGIRALVIGGVVLSRKFKPIPNKHIQAVFAEYIDTLANLDGELMIPGGTFNDTQSAVMSEDGEPEFTYHVFDHVGVEAPFQARYEVLRRLDLPDFCRLVEQVRMEGPEDVAAYEEQCLAEGHEGLILRGRFNSSPYKSGRSTLKEAWLLKLKRWTTAEGKVIDFVEQLQNLNEVTVNELGLTKRSSRKDGKVPAGTLGSYLVESEWGVLNVGAGGTDELNHVIWQNRSKYLGKTIQFKFQESGMKEKPRFPIWTGFRHEDDL